MGWLGYTEAETLACTIPALENAFTAYVEAKALTQANRFMLGETPTPSAPPPPGSILAAFRTAAAPKPR